MTKSNKITEANPVVPAGRPGVPNPVDIHVGKRIREKRILLGYSQTQLAKALGITFQQVQKYENGTNRVSASRLVDLSSILSVAIGFFFDSMPTEVYEQSPRLRSGLAEEPADDIKMNPMMKRETLELVRVYYQIEDPKQRKSVVNLCRSLIKTSPKA